VYNIISNIIFYNLCYVSIKKLYLIISFYFDVFDKLDYCCKKANREKERERERGRKRGGQREGERSTFKISVRS